MSISRSLVKSGRIYPGYTAVIKRNRKSVNADMDRATRYIAK